MQELVNPRYYSIVRQSIVIVFSCFISIWLPFETIRTWGLLVLLIICYAIINDLIACHICTEYFTAGHFFDGKNTEYRLLKTINPTITALIWGIVTTTVLAPIGCCILTVIIYVNNINSTVMIKLVTVYLICVLLIAEVISRSIKYRVDSNPYFIYFGVPIEYQSRWHAISMRNLTSYIGLIGGGIICSIICTINPSFFVATSI